MPTAEMTLAEYLRRALEENWIVGTGSGETYEIPAVEIACPSCSRRLVAHIEVATNTIDDHNAACACFDALGFEDTIASYLESQSANT